MKLQDIEALLDKADDSTHIYNNVPLETIMEFKRTLGGDLETRVVINPGTTLVVQNRKTKVIFHSN